VITDDMHLNPDDLQQLLRRVQSMLDGHSDADRFSVLLTALLCETSRQTRGNYAQVLDYIVGAIHECHSACVEIGMIGRPN
jgi:hypothetical protein